MKNLKSKKGFSLIELIVVIAVIAAIAAIIVPSISNFSSSAKVSADQRNVQLWNATYATAYAAGGSQVTDSSYAPATTADGVTTVTAIDDSVTVNGNTISFKAESFDTQAGTATFTAGTGLAYTKD